MTGTVTDLYSAKARASEALILEAALAAIEAGEEPTMRAVAKTAGVSERTVYRYFPSREDLYTAFLPLMTERASAPKPTHADGLLEYARALYGAFAKNEALVSALARAPWAAELFAKTRPRHFEELCALLAAAYPHAPAGERAAAAANLRVVLSGGGWVHLRECGLSPEGALESAAWLIHQVHAGLGRHQKSPSKKERPR